MEPLDDPDHGRSEMVGRERGMPPDHGYGRDRHQGHADVDHEDRQVGSPSHPAHAGPAQGQLARQA